MKEYWYSGVYFDADNLEKQVNKMAAEGWILHTFSVLHDRYSDGLVKVDELIHAFAVMERDTTIINRGEQ